MFYLGTSLWAWFFLGGLWSDYYQNWPFWKQFLVILILPSLFLLAIGKRLLLSLTKTLFVPVAFWASLYLTLPLLIYDFIFLHLFIGLSFEYLIDYWYLTFFTPMPFLILLPIAGALKRKQQ
jgi:hypothetical protein